MAVETEHVCEANHCVTCCPVATSYNRGWSDAKSWDTGHAIMNGRDAARASAPWVLLALVIVLLVVRELEHRK